MERLHHLTRGYPWSKELVRRFAICHETIGDWSWEKTCPFVVETGSDLANAAAAEALKGARPLSKNACKVPLTRVLVRRAEEQAVGKQAQKPAGLDTWRHRRNEMGT